MNHLASSRSAAQQRLAHAPWAKGMDAALLASLVDSLQVRSFAAGSTISAQGEPADHWLGLVRGMAVVESLSSSGRRTTFAIFPAGFWFGEGALLKSEPRPYAVLALQACEVAFMPRSAFEQALQQSWVFSRHVMDQLNARCGYFVALLENRRIQRKSAWVAFCLADLFQTWSQFHSGDTLEMSQQEVGRMCGLSRQNTNQALQELAAQGLLSVRYRGIRILNLPGLQAAARGEPFQCEGECAGAGGSA